MRTVEAYIGNGNFSWVTLDKDLKALSAENMNMPHLSREARIKKLDEKLEKEKVRSKRTIGYVDGKVLTITLYEDQTWSCVIWSSRVHMSGTYRKM